jgi:hypothetical protein
MSPRRLHSQEFAIVLFATRGLADFMENALVSIERCGVEVDQVEVVVPADAERELGGVTKVYGAKVRVLEQLVAVNPGDIPDAYVEYGSPEFSGLMKYRFPVLRSIMAEGKRIIYSDLDVVWLRNPLPYLSNVLDSFPCAFQTESIPVFPPMICAGFVALSDSSACRTLVDHFIARFQGKELKRTMQPVLRDILIENKEYLADIFLLPEGLFPNGLLYCTATSSDPPPVTMTGQLQPFIFHGNWVQGLDQKRRFLMHAGLWLVP